MFSAVLSQKEHNSTGIKQQGFLYYHEQAELI